MNGIGQIIIDLVEKKSLNQLFQRMVVEQSRDNTSWPVASSVVPMVV